MHPDLIPVFGFMMVAGTITAMGIAVYAAVKKINAATRKSVPTSDDRVFDLEERIMEVEERLDFHERILTDVKEQAKLERGPT